jgi:hypothetical protein
MCGCGKAAPIAGASHAVRGWVRGKPVRYLKGHGTRRSPVDYLVDESGCWVWQLGKDDDGYGRTHADGRTRSAHKVYWERENGPVPNGLQLDHKCRRRDCVNPAHLEPVTNAENCRRGIGTKLTWSDVDAIRTFHAEGERSIDLAARFGIRPNTVTQIVSNRRWTTL